MNGRCFVPPSEVIVEGGVMKRTTRDGQSAHATLCVRPDPASWPWCTYFILARISILCLPRLRPQSVVEESHIQRSGTHGIGLGCVLWVRWAYFLNHKPLHYLSNKHGWIPHRKFSGLHLGWGQMGARVGCEPIFFSNAADFEGFWFIFSIRGIAASILTRLRCKYNHWIRAENAHWTVWICK